MERCSRASTRGRRPRAPIVVLCAAIDAQAWAESIRAAAFIVKPFDIDTLLATVAAQLEGEAHPV